MGELESNSDLVQANLYMIREFHLEETIVQEKIYPETESPDEVVKFKALNESRENTERAQINKTLENEAQSNKTSDKEDPETKSCKTLNKKNTETPKERTSKPKNT